MKICVNHYSYILKLLFPTLGQKLQPGGMSSDRLNTWSDIFLNEFKSLSFALSGHQEVTATCAKQLGQREHEFNLKLDEMHAALLSKDLKVSEILTCLDPKCCHYPLLTRVCILIYFFSSDKVTVKRARGSESGSNANNTGAQSIRGALRAIPGQITTRGGFEERSHCCQGGQVRHYVTSVACVYHTVINSLK